MKFTEKLAAHLTPEWRVQYINYKELKGIIINGKENAPADTANWQAQRDYYAAFDDAFFRKCDDELAKINAFFEQKLAESRRKHIALKAEMKKALDIAEQRGRLSRFDFNTILPRRKSKDFEFAFSELYLQLVLLQNYQALNHTGFRKILKKHDKVIRSTTGAEWFKRHVDSAPFYTNHELMSLIRDTEDTVTYNLKGGDRASAMKRLRVPPLEEASHPWTTFRVGLYLGALTVLTSTVALSFRIPHVDQATYEICLRIFRAPFSLILYFALLALNVLGWVKSGINYVLIFELDPRDHLAAVHIMEVATVFALFLMLTVLGFLHATYLQVSPFIFPLVLLVIMLGFWLNPFRVLHFTARRWAIKLVGRVAGAPFFHVGFAEFFLGDQLISLQYMLVDYEYVACFYFSNINWIFSNDPWKCFERDIIFVPLVQCLAPWIRIAQCLRRYRDTHLFFPFIVNAGKYATSIPTIWFRSLMTYNEPIYSRTFDNPYVWPYIISHIVQSVYYLLWDLKMDFGLFKKFSGENIFLRDQLLYQPSFYYFAIIENCLLRFLWVLRLYLYTKRYITLSTSYTLQSLLEIFRRYIWNYLRLENEHLFNCGNFRAVRDIFVTPIDTKDVLALERIMDEVDATELRNINEGDKNQSRRDSDLSDIEDLKKRAE